MRAAARGRLPDRPLEKLKDRITDDMPYWRTKGITIFSVGAKHNGNGVEISCLDPAAASTAMRKYYGQDTMSALLFVKGSPAEAK